MKGETVSELNLRRIKHLVEVCDSGCSVSHAASKLNVAQSVVSRSVGALEREYGSELFIRQGKRLVGPTPLCLAMLGTFREILTRVDSLGTIAADTLGRPVAGRIRVACTHLQARYVLPQVLGDVVGSHPDVRVTIHQGFPADINDMLMDGAADLGICSEALGDSRLMEVTDAFSWERALIAPPGHPLLKAKRVTLKRLAAEPVITYVPGITGRRAFDEAFVAAGLYPNVVVEAADSDVIKEFTRRGHGVGVISEIAYDAKADSDLGARCLTGTFKPMVARVFHRADRMLTPARESFIGSFCRVSKSLAKRCRRGVT